MITQERKTVLLVEDEPIAALAGEKIVRALGYDVVVASSGKKAVELALDGGNINLVLMDMDLGSGIDGPEAARQILKRRSLPIVFLTSQGGRDMVERVRGITRYGYVLKSSGEFVLQSSIEMAFDLFDAQRDAELKMGALRRSEARFRFATQSAYDAIITIDTTGTIVGWNKGAENTFGYTEAEINGHQVAIIVPQADLELHLRGVERAGRSDHNVVGRPAEMNGLHKTGKVFPLELSLAQWETPEGTFYTGIIRDISERKQAENALRESEERYRSILKASPDDITIADLEGRILMVSPAALTMFGGKTDGDWLGRPVTDFLVYEDRERASSIVAGMLQGVMSGPDEYRGLRLDGSTFDMEVHSEFIRGANGQQTSMIIIVRDVTRRKQAEAALRASEKKYRLLLDTSNESIIIVQDGLLKFLNRKALDMLIGYSEHDVLNRPFPDFVHPDDRSMVIDNYRQRIANEASQPGYAFRVVARDGEVKWVELNAVLMEWQGKPATLSFLMDITDRKRAEDKIKSLLAEKEMLLIEVHHRISNNMNTVRALLSLQESAVKDPVARAALKDAAGRVQSMMQLYNKLYRSESFTELSMDDYLATLLDEIVGNFPNRDSVRIEKHLDHFPLDAKRLSSLGMIVNELVTNIMKHAFAGRDNGIISVFASMKEKRASVIVQDNGIGISESVDLKSSAGFGLKLVDMLTEQLEGTIRVERESGTKWILEFEV